jgi:hypothetical protein
MFDDKSKIFGTRIAALITGRDLARDEAKDMFRRRLRKSPAPGRLSTNLIRKRFHR